MFINVPAHIENQEAYINAARARIVANALKTFSSNFPDVVNAVNNGRGSFFASLQNSLEQYGKLTEKQVIAVRNIIAKQDQENALSTVSDNSSAFVGTVGSKKVEFTLTIIKVVAVQSNFGVMYINIMSDSENNVVMYKGSKHLANAGDKITLHATIKAHEVYKRKAQTVIARPVVLSVDTTTVDTTTVDTTTVDTTTVAITKARAEWKQAVNDGNDELADEKLELYMSLRSIK